MLLFKLKFLKMSPLLPRPFAYFNLIQHRPTSMFVFTQGLYLNPRISSFFQKRFFFFLPSVFLDNVGLIKKKQIKERKAHFRMKPGYQVLLRHYRTILITLSSLRFYRHKRITNWVMTGASIDTPIFTHNYRYMSKMGFSSPVNYVYNWKYMV